MSDPFTPFNAELFGILADVQLMKGVANMAFGILIPISEAEIWLHLMILRPSVCVAMCYLLVSLIQGWLVIFNFVQPLL